ncbi:MAG: CPxCG-related zinc finger [Gaiellaceae bacterium]|nr:CPxCG-related zinc finger [Gaiellaceae bacterium]
MSSVAPFARSLEQELLAVLRGASLECPVCGEFVLHEGPHVRCPECGMVMHGRITAEAGQIGEGGPVQSAPQAG